MQPSDFQEFQKHWMAACEISANPNRPSNLTLSVVFNDLIEYPIEWVVFALSHHRRTNKFAPVVADILQIIKDHSGQNHPGADEAWALALESFDESKTVIWTQEIAQARAAAWNVYAEAGQIQAWKTFKDVYERILKTTHTPPRWIPCYGSDKQHRITAIENAVLKNLLPAKILEPLKIEHKQPDVSFLQLADMSAQKTDAQAAKAKISSLKALLSAGSKTDFETELALYRQNGKTAAADEIAESAKNMSEEQLAALVRRLKRENEMITHKKLVAAQMEKVRAAMAEEEKAIFEQALQMPRFQRLEQLEAA